MGKEVVNRRENLLASDIPPEIPDVSGFVKNTDKASASTLGLVKIGDNINISSAGKISVPVGSDETAGVYKVGSGLSVDENGVLSASGGGGGMPTFTTLFSGETDFGTLGNEAVLSDDYDKYDAIYCLFKNATTYYVSPFFMFTQDITYGSTMSDHLIGTGVANNQTTGCGMGGFWFTDKVTMKANGCPACRLIKVYGVKFN